MGKYDCTDDDDVGDDEKMRMMIFRLFERKRAKRRRSTKDQGLDLAVQRRKKPKPGGLG